VLSGAMRILLASRATQIPCADNAHLSRSYNFKKLISIQPGSYAQK
jgi:hypothetical protein